MKCRFTVWNSIVGGLVIIRCLFDSKFVTKANPKLLSWKYSVLPRNSPKTIIINNLIQFIIVLYHSIIHAFWFCFGNKNYEDKTHTTTSPHISFIPHLLKQDWSITIPSADNFNAKGQPVPDTLFVTYLIYQSHKPHTDLIWYNDIV